MITQTYKKKVRDLVAGELVDMNETICQQFNYRDPLAEFELGRVDEVTQENPDCWVVNFENLTAIALPSDFELTLVVSILQQVWPNAN